MRREDGRLYSTMVWLSEHIPVFLALRVAVGCCDAPSMQTIVGIRRFEGSRHLVEVARTLSLKAWTRTKSGATSSRDIHNWGSESARPARHLQHRVTRLNWSRLHPCSSESEPWAPISERIYDRRAFSTAGIGEAAAFVDQVAKPGTLTRRRPNCPLHSPLVSSRAANVGVVATVRAYGHLSPWPPACEGPLVDKLPKA